jgi:hypothetical protein
VTVEDSPDSETTSLTVPLAVTEPVVLRAVLTQVSDPGAGW